MSMTLKRGAKDLLCGCFTVIPGNQPVLKGGFTGENFVDITGPGHIEKQDFLPFGESRAQIDVNVIG
ncbi:MAG: hypothetical protein JRJ85_20760 [Deltaproteobacteria bacterium]|nr:hypothetical protein [Deltaproteobacteria bacterium]